MFKRLSNDTPRLVACLVAITLAACDGPSPLATQAPPEPAPQPIDQAKQPPAVTQLAQWRSYDFKSAQYGNELVQVFSDQSCAILIPTKGTRVPCTWQRLAGDRVQMSFPDSNRTLIGTLAAPVSQDGRKQTGEAAYLAVDLGNQQVQTFVLGDSPDSKLVQDTVNAEAALARRDYAMAQAYFTVALDQGGPYARLRLAWLAATTQEFANPALALGLLTPMLKEANYDIQTALAAAYAAKGQFEQALTIGEGACKLAPEGLKALCQQRQEGFRNKQPVVTVLKAPVVPAAPVETPEAKKAQPQATPGK